MSLDRKQLGERLRDIRQDLGFTQAEVAGLLELHRPAISEIEAGRRAVASEELYEFSRIYAVAVADLLAQPTPSCAQIERILFRGPGLETPAARAAIRRFVQRCGAERELEGLLGIEPPEDQRPGYRLSAPTSSGQAIHHGTRMAEQERRRLGLGALPLRNPLSLLERQGVRIGPLRDFEAGEIEGIYFETEELGACVAINTARDFGTGFRSAFTAAHEYAHWLLRDVEVETFRFQGGNNDLGEVRANAFAAAFLMPEEGVREYFASIGLLENDLVDRLSPGDVVLAMDHFGVSRSALLYRLQNLKLLAPETAKELRTRDIHVHRVAKALGLRFRRERKDSSRMNALVTEAWRRGLITTGRAADLIDTDVETFRQRMQDQGEHVEPTEGELLGAAAVP